jgi:hypothetical protein
MIIACAVGATAALFIGRIHRAVAPAANPAADRPPGTSQIAVEAVR